MARSWEEYIAEGRATVARKRATAVPFADALVRAQDRYGLETDAGCPGLTWIDRDGERIGVIAHREPREDAPYWDVYVHRRSGDDLVPEGESCHTFQRALVRFWAWETDTWIHEDIDY